MAGYGGFSGITPGWQATPRASLGVGQFPAGWLLMDAGETPQQRAEREARERAEAEQRRIAEQRAAFDQEMAAMEFRKAEAQKQASGMYTTPVYRYAGAAQSVTAEAPAATATPTTTVTPTAASAPTAAGSVYTQPTAAATPAPGQTAAGMLAIRRSAMGQRRRGFATSGLSIPAT